MKLISWIKRLFSSRRKDVPVCRTDFLFEQIDSGNWTFYAKTDNAKKWIKDHKTNIERHWEKDDISLAIIDDGLTIEKI
jgi:hypothetical protein